MWPPLNSTIFHSLFLHQFTVSLSFFLLLQLHQDTFLSSSPLQPHSSSLFGQLTTLSSLPNSLIRVSSASPGMAISLLLWRFSSWENRMNRISCNNGSSWLIYIYFEGFSQFTKTRWGWVFNEFRDWRGGDKFQLYLQKFHWKSFPFVINLSSILLSLPFCKGSFGHQKIFDFLRISGIFSGQYPKSIWFTFVLLYTNQIIPKLD